uniref:Elongin-A n=1 Tax=Mycena chlorophos TaxID=658473 RepID=A0ABQ0LKG6_MYCCL|nr:predicted protein [Mycena chlorophos]
MRESRVPTLVSLCQRVAAVHVDCISSLGDELSFHLVKPILERCSVDQLLRLEQASPHLQRDTPEIWRKLCFSTYPTAGERYERGEMPEPESWRDQYYALVEEEARRIEEVGNKLRRQRQEADERKKEQEVKFTTQVPAGKRKWGVAAPPKTLFQQAKSNATRLQKNMYSKPMLPPMPSAGKAYRVLPANNTALLPASSNAGSSSRVTVTTVIHKVPASSPTPSTPAANKPTLQSRPSAPPIFTKPTTNPSSADEPPLKRLRPNPDSQSLPPMRKPAAKRNPAASLFIPRNRAYSQRVQ